MVAGDTLAIGLYIICLVWKLKLHAKEFEFLFKNSREVLKIVKQGTDMINVI